MLKRGEERVDYIPGIPPTRLVDFPTVKLPLPLYTVGPPIPYLDPKDNSSVISSNHDIPDYIEWLNSQRKGSVLYVSMGSFLSVSSSQLNEIVAGVHNSGIRFLWVSRGETTLFKDGCGDMGQVVPWCDQLRVLRHPAVGGFWTHCGWNSTLEAVYAGVPMLASPIFWDQATDSKIIVEDWEIGWRVKREAGSEKLVTREEIAKLVKSFMDAENIEVREIRKKSKELQETCNAAIAKGGSSDTNLDSFIRGHFTRSGLMSRLIMNEVVLLNNALFASCFKVRRHAFSEMILKDSYGVTTGSGSINYFQWLDSQALGSVLYVSLGSFFSIYSKQMDEIASGLRNSGVGYFWVARGEALRLKENCGEKGIVVPWCD
ncbi:hypothetical protein OIU77_028632 [Salix suchowensis]|uniref:Uncharacterized protein n=1 Tax=Salix suchowensis TaxID=1278906 RepID=A0ABQ9BJV0_9ROSI|nr:hypothetical protein OIU77_028632 [Salix suchowensis]